MRKVAAGLLSLCLILLLAASTLAHTKKYSAQAAITSALTDGATTTYEGVVLSSKDACEAGRTVLILNLLEGDTYTNVASGATDDSGHFVAIGEALPEGSQVHAAVSKRTLKRSQTHKHICKASLSDPVQVEAEEEEEEPPSEPVDVTKLPLGDQKYSTSTPQVGYIYLCNAQAGGPGAGSQGPWFNGDGTWNLEEKLSVAGSVAWPEEYAMTTDADTRTITTNDLPSHTTGTYPIQASDPVYAYDKNPSSISAQDLTLELTRYPTKNAQPSCMRGEAGVLLTGSLLFNGFDAGMRDAGAWEVQDACDGHPQNQGMYHYHTLSDCSGDTMDEHSNVLGFALDGFGIYGHYGEDGEALTNADLDVCHGHTHTINWEGLNGELYHYHATFEFPYTVSCFRGTPIIIGGGGPPPPP